MTAPDELRRLLDVACARTNGRPLSPAELADRIERLIYDNPQIVGRALVIDARRRADAALGMLDVLRRLAG